MQIFEFRIPECSPLEFSLNGIRTHKARSNVRSSERPQEKAIIRDYGGKVVPASLSRTSQRVRIDRAVKRLVQAINGPSRGPIVDNGHCASDNQKHFEPPNKTNDNVLLFDPED